MSFISVDFALFVTLTLLVWSIVPKKFKWIVLLIASYAFYGQSGADNFIYIAVTTVSAYLCAVFMEKRSDAASSYLKGEGADLSKDEKKAYKLRQKKQMKLLLTAVLILNFGILAYLKYANLAIAHINLYRLTHFQSTDFIPFIRFLLPLGISFYTFQTMGYLIDIYYGRYRCEKNLFKFALYVSFFPQIIQGPISRFGQLAPELFEGKSFEFSRIKSGFYRIMWGLFKKLVIADRLAAFVSETMAQKEVYRGFYIVLAIFAYSMQIYGDFSGGIDVAIGVSEMFGIKLAENFERPFFSKSISEYWQRWHITLGTWFKDYIFYPLSLNKGILKLGRFFREHRMEAIGKRIPIYVPMFFVWALTGMWHGSEMRFVVWGLFNFVFIVIGTELEPLSAKITSKMYASRRDFVVRSYRVFKTFWLMSFLRLFDISKSVPDAFTAFRYVFYGWGHFSIEKIYENLFLPKEDMIVAGCAIAVMFTVDLIQRRGSVRERIFTLPVPVQWCILSLLIAVVSVFGYYGPGYDAASFIYGAF